MLVPTLGMIALAVALGPLTVWLARRVLEPAERLEEARRIARGRLRAGALRVPARLADRPRQPPGVPGGDRAPVGPRDAARPAAGPRAPRPRRLQADQRHRRPRRRRPAAAPAAATLTATSCAAPTGRSGSAATSSRSSCPGTDADGAHVVIRRLLAACLEGERPSGSARHGACRSPPASARSPGSPRDRESLYGQADAALYWGKRHGRTCVTVYDPERHEPADLRAPAGRAVRAGRPGRRDRCAAGRLPADLRPAHRRAARLRGPRPAAAGQRLRRPGLDVRRRRGDRPDRRARPRLPQHGHGAAARPAPARQPDHQPLAADAGDGRVQRPRAGPR